MVTRRMSLLACATCAISINAPDPATAEVYPSRPVTIVVPFSAGGPTDALARIVAEHMRVTLGRAVLIENAAGAGGSIGVGRVARAIPLRS